MNGPETPTPPTALRVGLVGAGPWATMFHAPALSGGDETELTAVWARRSEAAAELAAVHGAESVASFDELVERCDAIAFAVPPAVQAELAIRAVRAGRLLLLDKPIAGDVETAERLAEAVTEAGVGSVVLLTMRFNGEIRRFIDQARARRWETATLRIVSGRFSPDRSPTRRGATSGVRCSMSGRMPSTSSTQRAGPSSASPHASAAPTIPAG